MDRYSFTGIGNILIKARTAGNYNGIILLENEPMAYFKDVMIDIVFANKDAIAKQGINNLTVDSKSEPSFLRIQNIKTTESVQSLLYKKQENNKKYKTNIKRLESINSSLFLPIVTDEVLIGSLFIYSIINKTLQTNYTIDENTGEITGLDDGRYDVFYSVNKTASSTYILDTPILQNIAAEIQILGNLNGINGEAVLHISSMKLLSKPTLNFNNENPFVDTLEFAILNNKESIEINYYG